MQDPVMPNDSAIFDAHWPKAQPIVKDYIKGLLGRHGAIDEVIQEVAYTCLRRIATFDQQRNFTAWALGIARLEVFTHRRRQVLLPIGNYPELEVVLSDTHEMLSDQDELRRKALLSCQEKLSDQHRQYIDLYYSDNCSHEKMGEQLGMRSATVKVALSRIRALLRQCVEHRIAGTGVL